MIKLTIIIPHYNRPTLLRKLLNTIPNQPEIEVIVIDDNSNKEIKPYEDLVRDFSISNVNFKKNNSGIKGAGSSRNIGIDSASGEWLMFADSDDYFVDGFYEIVKKFFNIGVEVVYFRVSSVNLITNLEGNRHKKRQKKLIDFESKLDRNGLRLKYLMESSVGNLYNTMYLKSHHIRFDEVLSGEDKNFTSKASYYCQNFLTSMDNIYIVTEGSDNITMNKTLPVIFSGLEMDINKIEFLRSKLPSEDFVYLQLTIRHHLMDLFKYHGILVTLKTIYSLQKRKIKWFEWKFINPFFMLKRFSYHNKKFKKDKPRVFTD